MFQYKQSLTQFSSWIKSLLAISILVIGVHIEAQSPNIILISVDDMGWSDLGCYGSEIETPNIDRLAEHGIRFTQFHNTAKCFPSRACLLTGQYAQDVGYHNSPNKPFNNAITLGEYMQLAGYKTWFSGKHHGAENLYFRGFDHFYGLRDGCCNHFNPGKQRDGEPVPAQKRKKRTWCIDSITYQPYTPPEKDFYSTDYFTNYAVSWINKYQAEDKPFFLYLAYTAPHDPLMAWPQDIEKYKGKYNVGYEVIRQARYEKQLASGLIDTSYKLTKATHRTWASLSKEEQNYEARIMEVYAAMIDRLDQNIGRLLHTLEENALEENTLILFVSDNGASPEVVQLKDDDDQAEIGSMARWSSLGKSWANVCNTPFRYYKSYSYEGGINTPFIAYWPQKIEGGKISRYRAHMIDVMATFVDLTGQRYPLDYNSTTINPLAGESLLPAIAGKEEQRESPLYFRYGKGKACIFNDWKIVKHDPQEWGLYLLSSDPCESHNLIHEQAEKFNELQAIFKQWDEAYDY